jgi:virulence-associated protein VapD
LTLLDHDPSAVYNQSQMAKYAIFFDLDAAILADTYDNEHWRSAYADIAKNLKNWGFDRQQGSVYFATNEGVDAVKSVVAVQSLAKSLAWFSASVRDIRLLRIEDDNDLSPALSL